jgi:hypothetical protein
MVKESILKIGYLLCADWGKEVWKRRCCAVDIQKKELKLLDERNLTFERLLGIGREYGEAHQTLISLDLAIGVPAQVLQHSRATSDAMPLRFVDWIASKKLDSEFWNETKVAAEWSSDRPFISVPGGEGELGKFHIVAAHKLKRSVDEKYGGKSPFIVNGIPGTVGSGTRAFWRELHPYLQAKRDFGLWPFDGKLASLFSHYRLVVAENYPAVSYTSVFADTLPSKQLLLSKTHLNVRRAAIERLSTLKWIKDASLCLPDLEICIDSEDDFDALMAALAQFRLISTELGVADEESADPIAEGGILGTHGIESGSKTSLDKILGVVTPRRKSKSKKEATEPRSCPICGHVFKEGRSGWRDHVSSMKRHPSWNPAVSDKKLRQELFVKEFPEFLE